MVIVARFATTLATVARRGRPRPRLALDEIEDTGVQLRPRLPLADPAGPTGPSPLVPAHAAPLPLVPLQLDPLTIPTTSRRAALDRSPVVHPGGAREDLLRVTGR